MNFEVWFVIATTNIDPNEWPNMRPELENHWLEAIETHLYQGHSRNNAEALALQDLGDPQEANQVFQKTYLTRAEAKRLDRTFNSKRTWRTGLSMAVLGALMPLLGAGWIGVGCGVFVLDALLAWCAHKPQQQRTYLVIKPLMVALAVFAFLRNSPTSLPWILLTIWELSTFWWWREHHAIYRKLNRRMPA